MQDIDEDANKALVIVFIILIVLVNSLLIYRTASLGGFLYNKRNLTIISLSIGDIFLALFSLVVWAKVFYGNLQDLTCETMNSAIVYQQHLIHFVYALGLITLAVELVCRYTNHHPVSKNPTSIIKAVICSAVPWVLGLIIILPLSMVEENASSGYMLAYYSCLVVTKERFLAMYGVSIVLPVCLAVIVCFVVMCMRLLPPQYTTQVAVNQGTTQGVVISTHNTRNTTQQYSMGDVPSKQPMPTSPANYNYDNNHDSKLGIPEFTTNNSQHPSPEYLSQQCQPPPYSAQQYLPPPYFPQQQISNSNVIISAPIYTIQPQTPAVSALQDPGREKNMLLVVSIVMFICVMPLAVYTMGSLDTTYHNEEIDIILHTSFFWLSLFRSIITPVIWMCSARN